MNSSQGGSRSDGESILSVAERERTAARAPRAGYSAPLEMMPSGLDLELLFRDRRATIGIIGLGYVGMPLALAAWTSGFQVVGVDIDGEKVEAINAGKSYLKHIPSNEIGDAVAGKRLRATTCFEEMREVNAIIICVPTPLGTYRKPDLSYIESTAKALADHIQKGQLIALESTTWPGTTVEVVKPILEQRGLKSGEDFYLAFSPEREDPGNESFSTETIPKVVGGRPGCS